MLTTLLAAVLLGVSIPDATLAQDRPAQPVPAAPGGAGPEWRRALQLSDGRTFVTDGAMAIDAVLARPPALPADVLPPASASFIEHQMSAQQSAEFALSQVSRLNERTYGTPSGVHLNAVYVEFLRRALPAARTRLRTSGRRDPVVIVVDGKPVGVLMPLAQ
jgi:hypothetical protein